jgi:phosphatidylglycerol:prolipoprotein diacylglycerol transferase
VYPGPLLAVLGVEINGFVALLLLAAAAALPAGMAAARRAGFPTAFALDTWLVGGVAFVAGAAVVPALLAPLLPALGGTWSLGGLATFLAAEGALIAGHPAARGDRLTAAGVAVIQAPLAQLVGRLGCLAAGCCHGRPAWDLPWAVTFPAGSGSAFQGVPVHPTQLYEAAGLALLFALLRWLWSRPHRRAALLGVYLTGYGALRFTVEHFRGDARPMVGALSLNQLICTAAVVAGMALLVRLQQPARLAAEAS